MDRLGLYSLEFRRVRGNLIETYKMLRGLDRVDVEWKSPLVEESRTGGHCLKMSHSVKTEMR